MLADLEVSGYRPITLASYYELIGGCRYVSIETSGLVTQYTPADAQSHWSIWHWNNGVSHRDGGASRSGLSELPINSHAEWFGKAFDRVGFRVFEFNHSAYSYEQTFAQFIFDWIGGLENPYEIAGAFNAKHPVAERDRAVADLRRAEAELRAREERIGTREAFEEMRVLQEIAKTYYGIDEWQARQYNNAAEEVRRHVQRCLDARLPVTRLDPPVARNAAQAGYFHIPRAGVGPKLEIAQPTGKRAFMLDDEEE